MLNCPELLAVFCCCVLVVNVLSDVELRWVVEVFSFFGGECFCPMLNCPGCRLCSVVNVLSDVELPWLSASFGGECFV